MPKNTIAVSLPKARTVRGYAIERMPIGRMLAAMQTLQDAPTELVRLLFPEGKKDDVIREITSMTKERFQALLLRAAATLPDYIVRVFAQLSGIAEERLLNDPAIGLDGLVEMIDAWIEVNGIANFIRTSGELWIKVRKNPTSTGFSA